MLQALGGHPIFSSVVETWLEFRGHSWTSDGTRRNFELLARHWNSILGDCCFTDLRPVDIQRVFLALDTGQRSGAWVNKARGELHALFSWAIRLHLYDGENPVSRDSWPRKNERKCRSLRSRVYTLIDAAMLQKILDIVPIRIHRLLIFMWLVGLRISEALESQWHWVRPDPRDPDGWLFVVPDDSIKQRRGYLVPLCRPAFVVLGERGPAQERIFKECPSKSSIRHSLQRAGRHLGVRLSPHQFRRSCATSLLNEGVALPAVLRLLGWRTPPKEWLEDLSDSYYLGIDSAEARRVGARRWHE